MQVENNNEDIPTIKTLEKKAEEILNIMFERINERNQDISKEILNKILELKESNKTEDVDLAILIIEKCMDRNYIDEMECDKLFNIGKMMILFEKNNLITMEKLLKFCVELYKEPKNISYAIVDLILYQLKEKLYKYKEICIELKECIYFNEFTPLLSVYIEFGTISEIPQYELLAHDPLPKLHKSVDSIKLIADKIKTYSPSKSEMEEFSKVDIGKIIVHINDCNMMNHQQFIEVVKIEELSNDIKNNVRYLLNSSSITNVMQRANDLSNIIQPHYYLSFINFFIELILSSQINIEIASKIWLKFELNLFHPLFVSEFCKIIRKTLFLGKENVNLLIYFGKLLSEITLNKNFALTDENLDIKNLLIESYFKKTPLHYILIFVSSLCIQSIKSQFFHTRNAYIMQILSVLKEIYNKLKMENQTQLPLEIEQTFNNLNIDIKHIKSSNYLDYPIYIMLLPLYFNWNDLKALKLMNKYIYLNNDNFNIKYRDIEYLDISRMLAFFNISFTTTFPKAKALPAKVAIHYSIEKTFNEYANCVSERVNRGCLNLCEILILKDFPQEQYDDMLRRSILDLGRSIATSYSYTTLRNHLYSNLLKSFYQNIFEILSSSCYNVNNSTEISQYAETLANDNIDLLINIIQKYCGEKLLSDLVKRIANILELRNNCSPIEKSMRLASYNDNQNKLQQELRVNFENLSIEHRRCYSKFINYQPGFLPDISSMDQLMDSTVIISYERKQQLEIINRNIEELIEALRSQITTNTDNHLIEELVTLKDMIKYLIESKYGRVIVAIIKHLIMTNFYVFGNCLNSHVAIPLRLIVYFREILDLFKQWEGIGPYRLAKFVTRVVIEVPQNLQFSNETIFHLVRNFLIIVPDYDVFLAKCIDNSKNSAALRFAMLFCKTFLVNEKQHYINNEHLKLTLSTLQYLTTIKNDNNLIILNENLKSSVTFPNKNMDPKSLLPGIDFQSLPIKTDQDNVFKKLFITWLYHYYDDPQKHLDPNYISAVRRAFQAGGFCPNIDYWKEFMKHCLEYGFKECLREDVDKIYICRICDSMAGFSSIIIKSLFEYTDIGNVAAVTQLFVEISNSLMINIDACINVVKISVFTRYLNNFCLELKRPFINDVGDFSKNIINSHSTNSSLNSKIKQSKIYNFEDNDSISKDNDENYAKVTQDCPTRYSLLQLMQSYANLLHILRPTNFPKFAAQWQKVLIQSKVIPVLLSGGTEKSVI